MFGRVAVNYVKLLFGLTEERWRDVFFKVRAAVLMRAQLGSYHKLDRCTQLVRCTELFTQLCILYLHTHTHTVLS